MALAGTRVVEFAGLAPGPFAGLILADNGASVIRIDRTVSPHGKPVNNDILSRGKRSISVNTKTQSGRNIVLRLLEQADVLIDPYRPGVLEKMGFGPDVFLGERGLNKRLIYARIVGFPRGGPHQHMAGHDINYLALSGVLSMLPGKGGKPGFPLNLLADFAGGGMMCANGILMALLDRVRTGHGQVVDADMVSGARYVSSFPLIHKAFPTERIFTSPPGKNILDGGAPFYDVYECAEGGHMSLGCLEPQFFAVFITTFNRALPKSFKEEWVPGPHEQFDLEKWPRLREYIRKGFLSQTREFWSDLFHGTDACAVAVLHPDEASQFDRDFSLVPSPTPILSRFKSRPRETPTQSIVLPMGEHTEEILTELGYDGWQISELAIEETINTLHGRAKL
ncbi:CoA-transferase family III [Pterulicium gracile]|uniref:CoA-transferase family III n=1 Tax=Pterulicium gracile TaxID=1884261 RepID=A0A5C3QPM9_9AGAR|nr:CoA-transferase family III [Pterula gracilis]